MVRKAQKEGIINLLIDGVSADEATTEAIWDHKVIDPRNPRKSYAVINLKGSNKDDKPVEGVIIGSNRGGAVVQAEDVQGFIPLSQLVGPARELFVPKKENAKDGFIGMKITFKIFELNRRRNKD